MRDVKIGLEYSSGTQFQRLLESRKYRRVSKLTYKIIKVTFTIMKSGLSPDLFVRCRMHLRERQIEPLMISYRNIFRMFSPQLKAADWGVTLTQVSLPFSSILILAASQFHDSVVSMPQNPSHTISTLANVSINDLDRVEMTTYLAETTVGRL